jgi:hypothetical protein
MEKQELVSLLLEYEAGELTDVAIVDLFAHLIETGFAWTLQGHYGRRAAGFIKAGIIDEYGKILIKLDTN